MCLYGEPIILFHNQLLCSPNLEQEVLLPSNETEENNNDASGAMLVKLQQIIEMISCT